MLDKISAVIIVKNGANTIRDTFESLKDFSEVVLYDNGSTDQTLEIAAEYTNVKVIQGDFIGFGETKQKAVNAASNDWVLSLDADESVSSELVSYLKSISPPRPEKAFKVIRHNYFMGKHVDKAGWGNDWLVRLFNRNIHNFNNAKVHENVDLISGSEVEQIPHPIIHNAAQEIGQFLEKVNRYSEIRRKTSTKTYSPGIILFKAFWRFFQSYILKGGFLAGWRGLVISWSNANGVFFKYIKIYGDKHQ